MSSSSKHSHFDCGTLLLNITTTTVSKAQKRWRTAYAAIYSFRVMISLAKEIVSKRNIHYHSYTSLAIEPSSSSTQYLKNEIVFKSPINVDQTKLAEMVKEKDLISLRGFGGIFSVATKLGTDPENGIHEYDTSEQREKFGANTYIRPPAKGLLYFVIQAFKDMTILILLVCAALSLGFGIKEHGAQEGWYEGGSIFVAVFLVIVVSAFSNFRQERQFDKLSKISNNIKVEVARDGRRQEISIFDIVVGDIVFLKIGDQIPADGLFLEGYSLQVDESSMTGESEHVEVNGTDNPFLFSGAKVVDGHARMLVTAVGMNNCQTNMLSLLSSFHQPEKAKLDQIIQLKIQRSYSSLSYEATTVCLLRREELKSSIAILPSSATETRFCNSMESYRAQKGNRWNTGMLVLCSI